MMAGREGAASRQLKVKSEIMKVLISFMYKGRCFCVNGRPQEDVTCQEFTFRYEVELD